MKKKFFRENMTDEIFMDDSEIAETMIKTREEIINDELKKYYNRSVEDDI